MARFFCTPKPRTFEMKPRYWNPEKEEREALIRRSKVKLGISDKDEKYIPTIKRGDFKKGLSNGKFSINSQRKKSNTRILIFIVILGILIYMILK